MADFWKSSGYHLLRRGKDGLLDVTDEFIRAYLVRPEVALESDSCAAERALHQALLDDPRRAVAAHGIVAIADSDARDNYRVLLDYRDRLVAAGTVEGCYAGLFAAGNVTVPPLFVDHMVHVILRGILDGCEDAWELRAAELLFRTQKVSLKDGAVLLADEETVAMNRESAALGNVGRLLVEMDASFDRGQMDVLGDGNAQTYWARSDRYDFVFDASFGQPGQVALARVLEAWTMHMLGIETTVEPVREIDDDRWAWHIGLDAESSAILNDHYDGAEIDEDRMRRLLALFRLGIAAGVPVHPDVAGRPIYLGLAMAEDRIVRMKPQNLLVNMPLVTAS